jgi:hypothetical protein
MVRASIGRAWHSHARKDGPYKKASGEASSETISSDQEIGSDKPKVPSRHRRMRLGAASGESIAKVVDMQLGLSRLSA